ncbi:Expansin-B3 [Rhynchospora pubera]|uniref:Expansin-B3 n=1 Tax=Rhynchospora pubera TaxID=906938 RepID=A0AAV8F1G9_9POAL|nr:Expansin-B3 [Rhynchospora pubera]
MAFNYPLALIAIASLFGVSVAGPSSAHDGWIPASSTFYGKENESGPEDNGGKCGFKNINLPPFNSMTSCGSKVTWKGGKGCGSCFLMKCTSHPLCSGEAKLITITDECIFFPCVDTEYHFDMSGIAFGRLALPGKEQLLHKAGRLATLVKRVPCDYKGLNINFHVEESSNENYLALLTEYQNGEGELANLELKEAGSSTWTPMKQSWGKIWRLDTPHHLKAPFSIRITTPGGKKLEANDVIPAGYQIKHKYDAKVNFKAEL